MSAVPEPGPYYHNLIEVGAENTENWHVVTIRANNPAIRNGGHRNRPVPTMEFLLWLLESGIDRSTITMSEWIQNRKGIPPNTDVFFEAELYWQNASDALLFKLAWAGR